MRDLHSYLLVYKLDLHLGGKMKELFKVVRLAFYICALPLVATATVSAFQFLEAGEQTQFTASKAELAQERQATYIVRRNADGEVTGRVVDIDPKTAKVKGISGLSIQFAQNGNLVAKTTTDSNGNFKVGEMESGVYSFFGINKDAFVSFATRIVDNNEKNAAYSLFVETSATRGMVEKLTREVQTKKQTHKLTSMTLENRPQFQNLSGGSRVEISDDGELKGRAVSLYKEGNDKLGGTLIRLFQEGKLIDETTTDEKGVYTFYNVEDGVYDLVTAGKGGFAAFRFDAARRAQEASLTASAAMTLAPVQEFALTPFNDAVFTQDTVTPQDQVGPIPQDGGPLGPIDGPGFIADGFGGFAPGPAFGPGLGRLLAIPIIVAGSGGGGGGGAPAPTSPSQ